MVSPDPLRELVAKLAAVPSQAEQEYRVEARTEAECPIAALPFLR